MKKSIVVIIVVLLEIMLAWPVVVEQGLATNGTGGGGGSNPGNGGPPAGQPAAVTEPKLGSATAPVERKDITDKCGPVREKMSNGINKGKIADEIKNAGKGMISVYLSESLEKNSYGMSCGEIISCLRTAYIPVGTDADKKRLGSKDQEMLLIHTLRTAYPKCLIEAEDGLKLLSKYAGLVYQWIAGIVGAICILTIVISGIQISIGGLSQEEVSGAKDRISRSLIGMVVLFLSAFILYTINPIFFT